SRATMGGAGLFTRITPYKTPTNKPTANETKSTFIPSIPSLYAKSGGRNQKLERETIASQFPKSEIAQYGQVPVFFPAVARQMCANGRVGSTESVVRRLRISTVMLDCRPVRAHGRRGWCELRKFRGRINDLSANHGEDGLELLDLLFRYGKIVR